MQGGKVQLDILSSHKAYIKGGKVQLGILSSCKAYVKEGKVQWDILSSHKAYIKGGHNFIFVQWELARKEAVKWSDRGSWGEKWCYSAYQHLRMKVALNLVLFHGKVTNQKDTQLKCCIIVYWQFSFIQHLQKVYHLSKMFLQIGDLFFLALFQLRCGFSAIGIQSVLAMCPMTCIKVLETAVSLCAGLRRTRNAIQLVRLLKGFCSDIIL